MEYMKNSGMSISTITEKFDCVIEEEEELFDELKDGVKTLQKKCHTLLKSAEDSIGAEKEFGQRLVTTAGAFSKATDPSTLKFAQCLTKIAKFQNDFSDLRLVEFGINFSEGFVHPINRLVEDLESTAEMKEEHDKKRNDYLNSVDRAAAKSKHSNESKKAEKKKIWTDSAVKTLSNYESKIGSSTNNLNLKLYHNYSTVMEQYLTTSLERLINLKLQLVELQSFPIEAMKPPDKPNVKENKKEQEKQEKEKKKKAKANKDNVKKKFKTSWKKQSGKEIATETEELKKIYTRNRGAIYASEDNISAHFTPSDLAAGSAHFSSPSLPYSSSSSDVDSDDELPPSALNIVTTSIPDTSPLKTPKVALNPAFRVHSAPNSPKKGNNSDPKVTEDTNDSAPKSPKDTLSPDRVHSAPSSPNPKAKAKKTRESPATSPRANLSPNTRVGSAPSTPTANINPKVYTAELVNNSKTISHARSVSSDSTNDNTKKISGSRRATTDNNTNEKHKNPNSNSLNNNNIKGKRPFYNQSKHNTKATSSATTHSAPTKREKKEGASGRLSAQSDSQLRTEIDNTARLKRVSSHTPTQLKYGTYTWPNGDTYEGYWNGIKREGHGVFTSTTGNKYDGEWLNNERHGKGTYYFSNGDQYEGQYVHNRKDGYGVFTFSDGDVYEGYWKGDMHQGEGKYKYASGNVFEGHYENDKRNGEGVFYWNDGDRFEGLWVNDQKHSKGRLIRKTGEVFTQWFDNGNLKIQKLERSGNV